MLLVCRPITEAIHASFDLNNSWRIIRVSQIKAIEISKQKPIHFPRFPKGLRTYWVLGIFQLIKTPTDQFLIEISESNNNTLFHVHVNEVETNIFHKDLISKHYRIPALDSYIRYSYGCSVSYPSKQNA